LSCGIEEAKCVWFIADPVACTLDIVVAGVAYVGHNRFEIIVILLGEIEMVERRDSHDSDCIVIEDSRDIFGGEFVRCVADE
jgi:hypothetical protein